MGIESQRVKAPMLMDDQAELKKRVLALAWPAIVENLLHTMVGIVDTAMVGRLGASSLAAVGLANQIFNISFTVFAALATGSTALVARHIGAEEPKQAGEVARQSLIVGFFVSGSVMLLLLWLAPGILGFLFRNSEPQVLAFSSTYVRIVASVLILNYFLIIINAILRGAGDTKTPMRITALVNVVNIIGNIIFIYGIGPVPAMGVAGAAVGTAIAQGMGGIIALIVLLRNETLHIKLTDSYLPDRDIIRRIMNIGVPAGFEQGIMRVAQLIYTMVVSSLGTAAYAAHQVALNAESLSFMPGAGFATASTTLVGQNLGANRPDHAEQSGHISRKLAVIVMSTMGVIFIIFARPIVGIFSNDSEVISLAVGCLRLVAISQPALATWMVFAGGLRGAGDTRAIVKITSFGFIVMRLGLAYLLAIQLGYGLIGAWVAMVADLFWRGFQIARRFRGGQWKSLKV